jgi:hypothetical protein
MHVGYWWEVVMERDVDEWIILKWIIIRRGWYGLD